MNNYRKLTAWVKAKELAMRVYLITDLYPQQENYALSSQTTRAAVSIVANIAEGSSRKTNKDFCHFLDMSIGSLFELETLLDIAFERRYFSQANKSDLDSKIDNTVKLIYGLKRSLNVPKDSQL